MTHDQSIKEEDYGFFDNFERYINDGKSIEDAISIDKSSTNCNSFSEAWGNRSVNKDIAKNICDHVVSLYKYLSNENGSYKQYPYYNKDIAFLSYWVNWKTHEGVLNENETVSDFFHHIESHALVKQSYYIYPTPISDINKDELDKMNKLYNLYKKYSELKAIINTEQRLDKQEILRLSTACCTDYNDVSYICNPGNNNNPKFCEKLNEFKSKYEELNNKVDTEKSEFSDYVKILSNCPNTKIISTAVTGSIIGLIPLLGGLYKFTPMGQVLRSKIGILNNDISNNDEEMIKMSLMEQENESLKFQQGTYNIKYQSI